MDILRRDFLNGVLVAAGGAALTGLSPLQALAAERSPNEDPRMLRGGNLPSAFMLGHWLRDRRVSFPSAGKVAVAASESDAVSGTFDVEPDSSAYDVIIVGSGLSGLSTAFWLSRMRPRATMLVLDVNAELGGNAGRDDASPLAFPSATGGAYAVAPYADFLRTFYSAISLPWEKYVLPDPIYSYLFDEKTPHALPGTRGWTLDAYGKGLEKLPYPPDVLADLVKARQVFTEWYDREGSPTDPPDASDPSHDGLSQISLHDYLTRELKLHPAVSDFYTCFSVDALGGTTQHVNAHAGISFLGAEFHPMFALPGGTNGIARHLVKTLNPAAFARRDSSAVLRERLSNKRLDAATARVRIRQGAMAIRADTTETNASVVWYRGGKFHRSSAKAVILAGQGHVGQHLVAHLLDEDRRQAWAGITRVPVVTASIALKNASSLVKQGLGFNQYWWGSKHWADFTIADWCTSRRKDPRRSTVLTFYGGNWAPPEEMGQERLKLLNTPFGAYESSLREDLARTLGPGGFEFDRDVRGVFLYRWGHGMLMPQPGALFGSNGDSPDAGTRRVDAPRHIARRPLGRIHFAGQDVEGTPSVESAVGCGQRVANEVLGQL
jgi:spermidine dehydrogenase